MSKEANQDSDKKSESKKPSVANGRRSMGADEAKKRGLDPAPYGKGK